MKGDIALAGLVVGMFIVIAVILLPPAINNVNFVTNNITTGNISAENVTGTWTGGITVPSSNVTDTWTGGVTVPATNVSAGTFPTGNGGFTFPQNVTVRMNITATQILVNITTTNSMGMCWNGTHTVIGNLSEIACLNNG